MADAVAEEPAVKLEFQNFGSSGEGVLDGRIGRGATPGGDMCIAGASRAVAGGQHSCEQHAVAHAAH